MRKYALSAFLALVVSSSVDGAPLLFPTPLHITRQVHDPISGQTTLLNEYGYGNRLITVRGSVTAIADYEKGELIEIDRDGGTYSVTRFDALARLAGRAAPRVTAGGRVQWALRNATPAATKSGRVAEFFEAGTNLALVETNNQSGNFSATMPRVAKGWLVGCGRVRASGRGGESVSACHARSCENAD